MSEVLYMSCAKGLEYLDQTIKYQGVDGGSSLVCRKPSVVVLAYSSLSPPTPRTRCIMSAGCAFSFSQRILIPSIETWHVHAIAP